jgi:hypothetical protein
VLSLGHAEVKQGLSAPVADEGATPRDGPSAAEVFAERVAPLIGLVERWRARIGTEAGRWPAVPLPGLEPDNPRANA